MSKQEEAKAKKPEAPEQGKNSKKGQATGSKQEGKEEKASPSLEEEEKEYNWEEFQEITNGDFKRLMGCG